MTIMKKTLKYILLTSAMGLTLAACQDSWDDHYNQQSNSAYGGSSLYEALSAQPELSDFCRVLDATKLFANGKQTNTTYKDLLSGDQFFTVWAPVNGSFDAEALIRQCQSSTEGDSLVEIQFLKNHIARYSHSVNGDSASVYMMNGKHMKFDNLTFGDASIRNSVHNIGARNGLIHVVEEPTSYFHNIYEFLANQEEYQYMGAFWKSYQQRKFDESMSLAMGIDENGNTVYIDSVFYSYNRLENYYGEINCEDSLFWMIVPTKQVWDSVYAEAKEYYDYGAAQRADSISEFFTYYALMQDLVYNPSPKIQWSIDDSITSTNYYTSREPERYHVYYRPFEPGGLFNLAGTERKECSNGSVFVVNQWPFTQTGTYFRTIRYEAEGSLYDKGNTGTKELTLTPKNTAADSVSNGYLILIPETNTDKFYVEFELTGILSGTYDISIVVLPKSVDPSRDMSLVRPDGKPNADGIINSSPNKFTAELTIVGKDGQEFTLDQKNRYTFDMSNPHYYEQGDKKNESIPYFFEGNFVNNKGVIDQTQFQSDPLRVDTIKLCTVTFPTSNYGQPRGRAVNRLKITNSVKSSESADYANDLFLDCLLLKPHSEK